MTVDKGTTVLKLGGELLEEPAGCRDIAAAIHRLAVRSPLVVVHGGGREIDAEMAAKGIPKRTVDGLRVTDSATLDIVVGTLAGRINARLVAAARIAEVSAVGLTAIDTGIVTIERVAPYSAADGSLVNLGLVGKPTGVGRPELLDRLCQASLVPIIASIGADNGGQLLNVNADTLAGHLAVRLGATRFLIAGGTAGVLDQQDRTIPTLDDDAIQHLIADGRASAGMVAKLLACHEARLAGVDRIEIIAGMNTDDLDTSTGTRIGRQPSSQRRND